MILIYIAQKNYAKTEECLLKAIKIATDHFGESSPQTFEFSWNLLAFYLQTHQFQEAFSQSKKALSIALKVFPKESVEVARCYHNLGNLYLTNRQIGKALEALEEAIKIYEKLPKEDFKVLSDLYSLVSHLHHLQGKNKEASALFIKSNNVLTTNHAENDPEIVETYLRRAVESKCLRRWDEAEDYLRKTLKICQEGSSSINKLRIVDIHFSLGEISYEKQEWETALRYFQETEKLYQECQAESFALYLLDSYLGSLSIITKDYSKGASYLEKAVENCEIVGDIGFLLSLYCCLEKVYKCQGKPKEKDEVIKKFRKYENLDQRRPNSQTGMKRALQIFWKIFSLENMNKL